MTDRAAEVLERLVARGETLAVAESLTGGLVVAGLVAVPGASRVVRGGVVTYATDLKTTLLGVSEALLAAQGPVHPDVALQMAAGVRVRLGATVGVATTGVAGPGPQDGHAAGTVYVAVATADGSRVARASLEGGRSEVRAAAAALALDLVLEVVAAA